MTARPVRRPALGTTVTIALVAVYMLIMAGATTAIMDATAHCSTWPTCTESGALFDSPAVLVALGHRFLALVTGVLILVTTVQSLRTPGVPRRVTGALATALVAYPVQVGIGAVIALTGPTSTLSGVHLVIGMGIFTALLLALVWILAPDSASIDLASDRRSPEPTPPPSPRPKDQWGSRVRAYFQLMKPRLMWLLCLVAAAGMALAAGPTLTLTTALATFLGGVIAIGASGTFNHVLERDIDQRMERTADRPLATATVSPRNALVFGLVLATASVLVFATINWLAAALGLAAILYYSVVYTLVLKPNTPQNTVIGGFAGSFPALIGAAAATNTIGIPAIVLALVIFLWTPAHFYNLALAYRDDYERGEFPMFPVVYGETTTLRHICYYLGATFLATAVLAMVGGLGWVFALITVGFGIVFLWAVVRLHRTPTRTSALRSFHASNAFLGALLVAIVIDVLVV